MDKKVSLIIPTLNEGENLSMTLESIQETITGAYEIIVVDNGSTDDSTRFIEQTGDSRIRLLKTEERLGVAGARNYGAAFAESNILIFIDAHMLFPQNWLTPILDVLDEQQVQLVVPAVSAWGNPHAIGYGISWKGAKLEPKWLGEQSSDPYSVPLAGGCFQAFHRAFFYEIGGYDSGMTNFGSEDLEMCLRVWLLGHQVKIVPRVEISHRFRRTAPFEFGWIDISYNFLRLVYAHFNEQRIERVLAAHAATPSFDEALKRVRISDIWLKRRTLELKRTYDDDWFFRTFDIKECEQTAPLIASGQAANPGLEVVPEQAQDLPLP
ncbi:MAG TPA: glycosyltransferase [Ktedonobacteraceae bacterium]|nr:glycosyltransferase [Ktedonobacteraceae bacterium]